METALDATDKIRDTADAFERIFIVEVMGRHSGFLATSIGIACGAEQIICPELHAPEHFDLQTITQHVESTRARRGKSSYIIVMSENSYPDGAVALAHLLSEQIGIDCRACVLGHIQRGGSPVASDRILATKLGAAALEAVASGKSKLMIGESQGAIACIPLDQASTHQKTVDTTLLKLQQHVFDHQG